MTPAAAAAGDEGRAARACDSCLCRRAGWYCLADDAFLCQGCDLVVHSANPLASRHERVRLKVSSCVAKREQVPSWMKGLKRKARTPRVRSAVVLVPDLASSEEHSADDREDQLLYRVPVFNHVAAEFRSSSGNPAPPTAAPEDCKQVSVGQASDIGHAVEGVHGIFLPTDAELAEFAADVESLLGRGLYEESSFCMDGLGLMEVRDGEGMKCCFHGNDVGRVKVELAQDDVVVDGEAKSGASASSQVMEAEPSVQDTLELNFDYDSPGEDEEMVVDEKSIVDGVELDSYTEEKKAIKIALRLDYKSVMAAWASQGSPWTTGDRPKLNPDDAWPDCIGGFAAEVHPYGGILGGSMGDQAADSSDGGREARVLRYREKRRTRLFSKKIRYEVRKLNAEKRPRMKGRFVKRASFAAQGFALRV